MSPGTISFVTGLPSSGKSTLAEAVRARLTERGTPACVLDGDAVREALVPTPGYTPQARDDFYRTLGNLAALLCRQGVHVIVAATANRAAYRAAAKAGAGRFFEVWVDVPLEECRRRDAKGLYAAYRHGRIAHVPGEDAPYEPPATPDVVAHGGKDSSAIQRIVDLMLA